MSALSTGARTHLLVETMRRAYYDRATHLGDPDFHAVPTKTLISHQHARQHMKSFSSHTATESASLGPVSIHNPTGTNTTHFSVLDQHGNIASVTMSINFSFGSGIVAGETGILLNNEMDDFSAKPGSPNAYGLVGAEANAIAAEKRPLSSMSPTIIHSPTQTAILGTPGGSRIITMVYLASLEALQGKTPAEWVALPRFHHQYLPDEIQYEPDAFTDETLNYLHKIGHTTKALNYSYGNMHAILWNKKSGSIQAASDPRGIGSAIVQAPKYK